MQLGCRPAVRVVLVLAVACLGLALAAPAALGWQARIQVAKVNQGGNPNDAFAFQSTFATAEEGAPATAGFSLKGGETSQPFVVRCNVARAGHVECDSSAPVQIAERPTPGYALTGLTCRYTQSQDDGGTFSAGQPGPGSPIKPADEVTTDLANGTVSLKVHYDEWVLCTFTNSPLAAPAPVAPVPVVAPAQAAPAPQVHVEAVSARSGAARLAGPTACATSDVVVARVTGRRIVRVTFYVQNRKIKTLHRPNRGSTWMLSERVLGLPQRGPYRVIAKVEFAKSSRTKPKTLRITQYRCMSGAARPQFTG